MTNRITITLKEYLDGGYTLPTSLDSFYKPNITGVEYDIKEMFTNRNLFKEIGSETQELFKHNLDNLVRSALSMFNFKLKIFADNIENVMKRTVTETLSTTETENGSENKNETNSGEDNVESVSKDYLNPVNSNAEKLTDKSTGDSKVTFGRIIDTDKDFNSSKTITSTKDRSFGFFKSNPEILQEVMKLDGVVEDILKYLDRAFIGEY